MTDSHVKYVDNGRQTSGSCAVVHLGQQQPSFLPLKRTFCLLRTGPGNKQTYWL